jgi:hypothetical protein
MASESREDEILPCPDDGPGSPRARALSLAPSETIVRQDFSWANVTAVLAILTCWIPILGLIVGLFGWWASRGQRDWTLRASLVSIAVSTLIHLGLVGLVLYEVMMK